MEALKIKWQKQAMLRNSRIATWYEAQMGTLDERRSTDQTKYYSFLSHPKYRIIYRFTKTTLYVVAIHATMMKTK